MRPQERPGELFAAFSRITAKAFAGDRLLSCPTLSKAPNYGNVLRRFVTQAPQRPLGRLALCRIAGRFALTNLTHLGFMLMGWVYVRVLGWKLPSALKAQSLHQAAKPLFIIDSFAVLPKVAKDGAFQDLYLPGLQEEAVKNGWESVYLYRLYGSRNPRTLWQAFTVLARQGGGITEMHLFTPGDWLRLCCHLVGYIFSLCRLIRSLKHYPCGSPESYIRDSLVHTAGQCVLMGEARRIAGYRLGIWLAAWPWKQSGLPFPKIASWYENQTLNKAFQRGLAQAEEKTGRHIAVTGAQLFIWPDTLLNNHPDDAEAALGLTPDEVLVSGPHFLPEQSRQRYSVGPSMRYGSLFARFALRDAAQPVEQSAEQPAFAGPAACPAGGGEKPLLVLLSYHPEETKRVLDLVMPLANACGTAGKGCLVYKFHPATNPADFTAWLPASPVFATGSLESALQNAGAVIGSGSGSLAEAAAMGIPTITVEDPSGTPGLGLNYLPEFGKGVLWASVRTADDVEKSLAALQQHCADSDRAQQVQDFRDLLFTEATPEKIKESFGL